MRQRLYLIRIQYSRIIGPMPLEKVTQAYRRLEFGLQDEICGRKGVWVNFEDFEAIKRQYPELAQFVDDDLLSGWGVSEPSKIIRTSNKRTRPREKLSSSTIFICLLAIILVSFMAYRTRAEWGPRLFPGRHSPSAEAAFHHYQAKNLGKFDQYIKIHRQEILRTGNPKNWIPLLRIYAFRTGGAVDGLSSRALKGRGAKHAIF